MKKIVFLIAGALLGTILNQGVLYKGIGGLHEAG